MTGTELALRSGVSRTKLSRIENGWVSPTAAEIRDLAEVLGLTADGRRSLVTQMKSGLESPSPDLPNGHTLTQVPVLDLEQRSKRVCTSVGGVFLPGILQTLSYSTAVLKHFAATQPASADLDVEYEILLRQRRRAELADVRKEFVFLISQIAIESRLCTTVEMNLQLRSVCEAAMRPNITVRVVPNDYAPKVDVMNYTFYDDAIVTYDTAIGWFAATDPDLLDVYRSCWADSLHASFSEEDSLILIEKRIALLTV